MDETEQIYEDICHARIGLMGNPSDGFNGKTLSFLINNFYAKVTIVKKPIDYGIELIDTMKSSNLNTLEQHSISIGYTSGMRLLQATCKVFTEYCNKLDLKIHLMNGFQMYYTTNIPRMVGLSGSSAIIIAGFRALLKCFNLQLSDLNINKIEFPEVILNIEKKELGISAGLQDRVIQTFGGLVHMDFTLKNHHISNTSNNIKINSSNHNYDSTTNSSKDLKENSAYTSLDPHLLPEMYLAYNTSAGGESGIVHNTVRSRWESKDPELLEGMKTLGTYADEAVVMLQQKNYKGLAILVEKNFLIRRKLYGDAVVGTLNLKMIELAKLFGLSAKFTGSGGALLCIRTNGLGWFSKHEEENIRSEFLINNFEFTRIIIPNL